ncbi:MAG: threonine ammonia-lyase [Thermoplasmatota archaeon]
MITRRDVEEAARRLEGRVRRTPLLADGPCDIGLKLENLQRTGSFKLRGATNAVLWALEAEPDSLRAGVSTMSAGNHGRALATAARDAGIPCTVYVPPNPVQAKVDAMRTLGAQVVERPHEVLAEALRTDDAGDGRLFIGPFAHPMVAAGQGTVGLEISEQAPGAEVVYVPIGGGGLSSGLVTALADHPCRIIGVTAEKSPALRRALRDGTFEWVTPTSIADGLGSPIARQENVALLAKGLDEVVVVTDDEIRAAMRRLALEAKVVAEPAGAAASAAAWRDGPEGAVAVVSGGNVDSSLLASVVEGTST